MNPLKPLLTIHSRLISVAAGAGFGRPTLIAFAQETTFLVSLASLLSTSVFIAHKETLTSVALLSMFGSIFLFQSVSLRKSYSEMKQKNKAMDGLSETYPLLVKDTQQKWRNKILLSGLMVALLSLPLLSILGVPVREIPAPWIVGGLTTACFVALFGRHARRIMRTKKIKDRWRSLPNSEREALRIVASNMDFKIDLPAMEAAANDYEQKRHIAEEQAALLKETTTKAAIEGGRVSRL